MMQTKMNKQARELDRQAIAMYEAILHGIDAASALWDLSEGKEGPTNPNPGHSQPWEDVNLDMKAWTYQLHMMKDLLECSYLPPSYVLQTAEVRETLQEVCG